MTRKKSLLVGLWLGVGLAATPVSAAADGKLVDERYGYSFDVPALGEGTKEGAVTRSVVLGPASEGFAPNLNVQVQYASTDRDAFVALSRRQFASLGVELGETSKLEVSGLPAALMAYRGDLGSGVLEYLALAVVGEDRVWLATCSMTPAQFRRLGAECRKSLLSLRILTGR